MAEVIGLAASIIQIAGAGAKLSVALYNFTNSAARADQDVKDIADDVELTSNALESVGRVFESEEAGSIVSKKAIQDAGNIIKKCQSVFDEVSEMVEKRRKVGKNGKKSLSVMGKLAWPMKEQRVELNRRRLESLKNSLVLLLHVLQLAQGQARGRMEKGVLDEERDKIRELHQRQQDSLKSLQALENRFCHIAIDDEVTLRGSSIASRVPTLELMTSAPVMKLPPLENPSKPQKDTINIELSSADDSDTSDSDATMSGDDNEEQISTEELARAADHVKKLLKRITMLQKSFGVDKKQHRKRHVHKMYIRFCRKFEPGIKPSVKEANFGESRAGDSFELYDSGGTLECFDFDSFLHVPRETTPFQLLDFNFPAEQHSEPQQANHLETMPSIQASQRPPLTSADSIEPVLSSSAQMSPYPPVPSGSAASDFPLDLSSQQQRHSLGQGQSALAQQTPETLSQTWARIQRQVQSTAQQQAQAQHQQAHSHAVMQPTSGMIQNLPSPAMPMLNRPMLPPASTSSSSMPTYSRPTVPEISQSSQSGVESSLHTQSPMLTADSTLLPQPRSANTALQDYMYQLMFLNCRERRSNPPPEQKQDGESQLMMDSSMIESVPVQSEKSEREDPHLPPHVYGWPRPGSRRITKAKKGKRASTRKRGLSEEQKSNAIIMRSVGACHNCKSLNLKCDYDYPCGSCIKRNLGKEELPERTCRGINIAEHTQGFPTGPENTAPQLGAPVPSSSSSGYVEPDAEDSPGSESLHTREEKRVVNRPSRIQYQREYSRAGYMSVAMEAMTPAPWYPYNLRSSSSSGYARPMAPSDFSVLSNPSHQARTPSNASMIDPYPSRLPDDGTEQDAGQRSSRKRRRLVKDEDEPCTKDAADLVLKLEENEEMRETETASSPVDRDIVDVLLEEWTVPVY